MMIDNTVQHFYNNDVVAYDAVILVTPDSLNKLYRQYKYYLKYLPVRNLYILGSEQVGRILDEKVELITSEENKVRLKFINEDSIIPFEHVHETVRSVMEPLLKGRELPRGITGWYYQQFLKLSYAYHCEDEYYLIWDGDTFPCCNFSMFSGTNDSKPIPYFDVKREEHTEYFETMGTLIPGLEKAIAPSFISEHMLFRKEYVIELLDQIESNGEIAGEIFWEKIIRCIGSDRIQNSSFSEYETYGTYIALTHPTAYRLREWHSFRLGGEFFDPITISDSDFEWLGRDFTAISFEKGQTVREDHRNLFDNPYYQNKLTAKQMLQAAQEAFEDGYVETWEDVGFYTGTNITRGEFENETGYEIHSIVPGDNKLKYLSDDEWIKYAKLGEMLLDDNLDQAYLCFENAEFLCTDEEKKNEIHMIMDELMDSGQISVRNVGIVILSYNNGHFTEQCLESIYSNCAPESFSVVVLDNASTDGITDWLKTLDCPNFQLLLSDVNMGFPGGCNEALKYIDSESDVLFLNNDTRVPANALFWLRMGLYSSNNVGATGALQNYASDQLIDVALDLPEQYMEYGAHRNTVDNLSYMESGRLNGFAMLVKKEVIDALGREAVFDERFNPGFLEDDDLSYRIRQLGYRLLVCNNSFIYHAGSQSFAKNPEAEAIYTMNRRKFKDKWGFDNNDLSNGCTTEHLSKATGTLCEDIIRQFIHSVVTMIIVCPGHEKWLPDCIVNVEKYATDTDIVVVYNTNLVPNEDNPTIYNNVSYLYVGNNLPYGQAVNKAIERLKIYKNVFIMDPEYRLTHSSITVLDSLLDSHDEVGTVSGVSNGFPAGWQADNKYNDFETAEENSNGIIEAKISGRVLALYSGALLLKMDSFKKVGGFDNNIQSEIGVILDYCFTLWKNGVKCCYTKDVFIWRIPESQHIEPNDGLFALEQKWGMHYFNINPNYNLPNMISRSSDDVFNVIEIGCDCGATLLEIQNRYPNARIYGSELNHIAAGIASCFAQVSVDNIEDCNLPFDEDFFDYIIFGDVLEHLHNPQKTIEYCAKMLKPGGCIISSIPNVMHISVMQELLNGDFHYEETGLLDKTHIHLFTGKEIVRMYTQAGFIVEEMRAVILPISDESEKMIDRLMLLSSPEVERVMYTAFQYVTLARLPQ